MSYSHEENIALTRCMAQPMVDALGRLSMPYSLSEAESIATGAMQSIDFESQGLHPTPGYDEESGPMMYTARSKANGFIRQAISDAKRLIDLCGSYTAAHQLPEGIDLQTVLLNSRGTLLRIADIEDGDVADLFHAINHADDMSHPWTKGISQTAAKMPLSLHQQGEYAWLDWHPDIKAWITAHELQLCPARKLSIEDSQGRKTRLINYVWEKLVWAGTPQTEITDLAALVL